MLGERLSGAEPPRVRNRESEAARKATFFSHPQGSNKRLLRDAHTPMFAHPLLTHVGFSQSPGLPGAILLLQQFSSRLADRQRRRFQGREI